jgi:hypothetical protein
MLPDPNARPTFRPAIETLEDRLTPAAPSIPFDPTILVTLAQNYQPLVTAMQNVQAKIAPLVAKMKTDAAAFNANPGPDTLTTVGLDYAMMVEDVELVHGLYLSLRTQGDAFVAFMLNKGYFGNANAQVAQNALSALGIINQAYQGGDNVQGPMYQQPPVFGAPVTGVEVPPFRWETAYPSIGYPLNF